MEVGGPFVPDDKGCGVTFLMSNRMASAVRQEGMGSGMYSSHIKWLRIETDMVPLYPVNVYIPHAGREQAKGQGIRTFPTFRTIPKVLFFF